MSFWTGRTVFVTGGTGFVGSWLIEELFFHGAKLICLVRDRVPDSRFFSGDLVDRVILVNGALEDFYTIERIINEYEPQTIFHLGAQTLVQTANISPLGTFKSNIEGTWNLLEASRLHDRTIEQIVVASSDKAYGEQKVLPYTEEMPLQGSHPYDVSKSCADLLSQAYAKTYGLPITISRCGNFFGGGDLNFSRIVPSTIRSAYKGESPIIRTDGKYVRDYIYVKDAAFAYLMLAEKYSKKTQGQAFNFSNEIQMTTLEMVQLILRLMKKKLDPIIQGTASGEIRNQHLSSQKAREVLGWKARYGIEEGLKETIKWYESYFQKRS